MKRRGGGAKKLVRILTEKEIVRRTVVLTSCYTL